MNATMPHACGLPRIILTATVFAAALITSLAPAAEKTLQPRLLVDPKNLDGLQFETVQARQQAVSTEHGTAIRIDTDADAEFPSVYFKPTDGRWDLSGYERLDMMVRNLQDAPVRVLLGINNPGAEGRKNCNVESATIPARSRGLVSVPFGNWHGDSNHPIDQANIVSVQVLLDRPGRAHRFAVESIRAMPRVNVDLAELAKNPFFASLKPPFGRGVNLGNCLDAPHEGEWGVSIKEEYLAKIKQAGFDSVRIPVRWSAHADARPPYKIEPKFFERVDQVLGQATAQQLQVVLNVHHYEEIIKEPDQHHQRLIALWDQIAARYRDQPTSVAFELLNEPFGNLGSEKWNQMAAEAIATIRRTNPTRQIVVGPVGWNSINELPSLELPESDRNLIVTVHYYSPFKFTHQGAHWAGPEALQWLGTTWTGTATEQHDIRRDLDRAIAWGIEHRRPIYLGEFGAYHRADMESRARWTRFVSQEALKRKIGPTYWEFCSGFGCYDPEYDTWIVPLRDALLEGKK